VTPGYSPIGFRLCGVLLHHHKEHQVTTCSRCGDHKADSGFTRTYCPNPSCKNFDQTQLNKVVSDAESEYTSTWEQLTLDGVIGNFED